ncbi:helix-turn-helix domain-containing protein [Vibrio parahaemolyticus]
MRFWHIFSLDVELTFTIDFSITVDTYEMQPYRPSSIHDARYHSIIGLLIQARKEKELSQQELAQKLGFTQPDISKIERLERRLDIIEFLDFLDAISGGDSDFFNQKWMEINECHSRLKSSC